MLNDARVASLRFLKDSVCTTRINKEKKFKINFQVLPEFAQILPDYFVCCSVSPLHRFEQQSLMLHCAQH